MKKILLITFSDNADHQDTIFGLFEEFKNEDDVYVMCIKNPKVTARRDDKIWYVDCPKRPGITKKTFNIFLLSKIIKKIRKEKFDVIYFESLHLWNLPILLFESKKTKKMHVIHEVIPHEGDSQEKMVHLMNKVICRFADVIVLHNRMYINEMVSRYNISKDSVKFLELWRRYPEYTNPVYGHRVLFFGRMNPYKGVDNLLKIVKKCPEINFDVVGKVDPQVEEIVNELKSENNVHMHTGYVSDTEMKNYFINSDWVIVPYNSASQSGIIIDAYKYSRPVLAFDVGAISEQVDHGYSGYLVNEKDINQFSKLLKKSILMNKEEYYKLSIQAYKYGIKKYSTEYAKKRFLKLIDEVTENDYN